MDELRTAVIGVGRIGLICAENRARRPGDARLVAEPPVTWRDGRVTVTMTLAATRSLDTGGPVEL